VKKLRKKFERAWKAFSEEEKPPPSKPKELAPTPFWIKVMTWAGAVVLVVMGFLVLREGLSLWKDDAPPAVAKRASEITLTKPAEKAPTATETGDQSAGKAPEGKEATGDDQKKPEGDQKKPEGDEVKTGDDQADAPKEKAAPSEQITGKWPTSPAPRSETLSLALLGTGAALLLAGAFAPRITSIKLPGGPELTMTEVAMALVSTQSLKDGKPEVAENPRKLLLGARMLIEQANVPVAQAETIRRMGPVGAEAMLLDAPDLEEQAKRVVEYLSSDQ
jgi:hypothetical protein